MDLLPEECLDIIVSYLDVVSLTRLGISSVRLRISCFSPRYWTNIDLSTCNGANIDQHMIEKLSQFATELQILNIQKCSLISLDSLVPFVFKFKRLELIKHDGQHRLLDETVAINRMLNNADKLIEAHKINDDANEEMKAKFDNAVRQARALLWDALFVVVANKRGTKHILEDEAYFENIAHPQETFSLVMKRLRETEQLLQKPTKLWQNTVTWKTAVKSSSFVKEPRTQQIYLAFGLAGEIVLWDFNTRSTVKVFNYLDSFETATKREAKKMHHFISILLFKYMDRVLLFGGTSKNAVCWDYDTKKIIYETKVPVESSGGYLSRYYSRGWAISDKGEGMMLHYGGAILFNLGTGEFGKHLKKPKGTTAIWSSLNNGLMLNAIEDEDTNTTSMEIINLFTEETKQLFEFNTPTGANDNGIDEKLTMDWFDDKLIAVSATNGIRIYQVDEPNCKLNLTITPKKNPSEVKFLSIDLLLLDSDIYNVRTGALELSLEKGSSGNRVIYSPELKLVIRVQQLGIAAMYNIETKQKLGPEPSVTPLCAISKLTDDTVLLHGNYVTFASYVNYHGRNYAKVNINDGKVLETVDTPLQVLDVSSDGKYALAQHECHSWNDRHDVIFKVFEVDTKKVVFEKKFLGDFSEATWYVSPVGRFMPKHPEQILLAHPQAGFQIFDVISGKLVKDFSGPAFDGLENHVKISPDERYVSFKTVRSNMGCNVAIDMIERKVYSLSGYSNAADSITFNPVNPSQFVTAGCGIRVFNLPNPQYAFFVTRQLDGLVQTVRESEEIACLKFSPNGKYMAVLDPPSRGPWGLEIANTLIRVYETTKFRLVSSFDTGSHARALYWLDNDRAVIGLVNGELLTLQLVVKEYFKLFEYLVPSHHKNRTRFD